MTPKKAIIIVLIMFLIVAVAFIFLYINQSTKPPADNGQSNTSAGSTDQEKLTPAQKTQQKIEVIEKNTREQVEQIINQGTTATGGVTVDAQRKIEEAVNQEIVEKMKLRTPEQIKADEQRRAEMEEAQRQINQQIEGQLPNK